MDTINEKTRRNLPDIRPLEKILTSNSRDSVRRNGMSNDNLDNIFIFFVN